MTWRCLELSVAILVVLLAGCFCLPFQGNAESISGIVDGEAGYVGSFLLHSDQPDPGFVAVPGAEIQIAFDLEGKDPAVGYATKSDAKGKYSIRLAGIAQAKNGDATYYLVVRKDGFETLIAPIKIGKYSGDLRNTIMLKPET